MSMRIFAKKCPGSAARTQCVIAFLFPFLQIDLVQNIASFVLSLVSCDPQVLPELKLQVSELQRQKQELEAHIVEQSRELAGRSVVLLFHYEALLHVSLSTSSFVYFFVHVIRKKKLRRSLTFFKERLKKRAHDAGKNTLIGVRFLD